MSNYGPPDPDKQNERTQAMGGGFQPPQSQPPQSQQPQQPGPQGGNYQPPQPPPSSSYGPPGTGPGQPAPGSPYGAPNLVEDSKGFVGSLFDFSFTHFITPKIVKFVYILITILLALGALAFVITGFADNAGVGILFLILAVIGYFVYLAIARMTLEFYLAIVRMSEDIHKRLR